ncbi:MAG TPA: hypothetical protein VFA21_16380, partial [Pyrinomonadaceae bacterium]|nr:hypothetical protein [Pyrinomonadaceae bacterium]
MAISINKNEESDAGRSFGTRAARALRRRLEFGDALMPLYLVVFVRQYLWTVGDARAAWLLASAVAALLWPLLLYLKDEDEARTPWQFWAAVALPLLGVYAMRAAIPDTSYDVLNYRLVSAERALRGWPFVGGDFFPPFYPLNPAPDMLLGVARHLLGYRLGTSLNLLALVWTGTVLDRMLRRYVPGVWPRSLAVLLTLWTEHALFLVNTYLVDLLALPLLLEATHLALRAAERGAGRRLVRIALLVGMSCGLKILNLAYAIPVAVVYLHAWLSGGDESRRGEVFRFAPLAAVAFLSPLAPYSLYMIRETGNPVFPLYNAVFKSPYWPQTNLYDGRWGPRSPVEMILWPLRVAFNTERTGELAVYSGRISLAVVAAVLCLLVARRDRGLRALSLATLAGALLWSATLTGYARYGLFVEMLGGVTVAGFAALLLSSRPALPVGRRAALGVAVVLLLASAAQVARASGYVMRYEWAMRPTVFGDARGYAAEARFLLRDYDLKKFFAEAEARRLTGVGAWVEAGPLTSGFESLLTPDAPVLCAYIPDYFSGSAGRERFDRALKE